MGWTAIGETHTLPTGGTARLTICYLSFLSSTQVPPNSILNFGIPGREWRLAPQEAARQAIPQIRGYIYQFHRTAEAWINLPDTHTLYLEVAEDFAEIARKPGQIDEILKATQVKDTRESGSITLNSEDVLGAIRKLFEFQLENSGRRITLHFLTTSPAGRERKNPLPSGLSGIEAWRAAARGGDVVEVREALLTRFPGGPINGFLQSSTADQLRGRLLSALTFSCDAADWVEVERRNREELVRRRKEVDASTDMADRAYDAIISEVVRTIVTPGTRALDRQNFLDLFSRASNYGVPSQVHLDMVAALSRGEREPHQLDDEALKNLAKSLLETGAPPSIQALFPDAALSSMDAWRFVSNLERFVVEPKTGSSSQQKLTLRVLAEADQRKHLVTSPPGNGKSFSLWQLAGELLAESDVVALFLPIGHLDKWQQVLKILSDLNPSCDPESVLRDSRVCVLLDGWSEFASGENLRERAGALRVLDGVRVIANARQADLGDTVFKEWSLEQLSPDSVLQAINLARPLCTLPAPDVLDLLRLPLLLSLFLLSESGATQTGQLLRQFQDHVAKRLPDRFTEALCVAASRVALAGDNSHQGLVSELRHCASERGIADAATFLQRLGTIRNRKGQVASLHDLYWSWLVGCGLLIDDQVALAASHIPIKESLTLALQSGQRVEPAMIDRVAALDVVLAAAIDAGWRSPAPHTALSAAIEKGLSDGRLSVRTRAGIAGVESRRPQFMQRSLVAFSEMSSAKLYMPEWITVFRLKDFYENRSTLASWIGSPGGSAVLEIIAQSGGPEWLPWLEQLAAEKRVEPEEALATALACAPTIPDWGLQQVDTLAKSTPWKLRLVAARETNLQLAHWLAANYDGIVRSYSPGFVGGFHLNKVLVACGDNSTFQYLLDQFCTMCPQAQEVLCYAVSDIGDPWISKFQKVAFASHKKTKINPFHKLSEVLGDDIDDNTARKWIADGYDEEGWRALIAHNGNRVVPELIAALPDSFSDQHYISALANMRHLQDAPKEIIPEIMSRVRGNMMPMATEHVLRALATVRPQGMIVIVDWMAKHAHSMPAYHVGRSLELYSAWKKSTSQDILVATAQGTMSYPRWIVSNIATAAWENHFTARMLASQPDLAIDFVTNYLQEDDVKAQEVLAHVRGVQSYNSKLFQRMIRTPKLAALIVEMFAECLDSFPASALLQLISSEYVKYEMLIFRLSTTSNIMHRPAHAELIKIELSRDTNLHHCRYLGNMLRSYNRHEALQLLKETTSPSEDRSIWLVREVETARKQRLLDECQRWIQ
jgi:hypothetical protein